MLDDPLVMLLIAIPMWSGAYLLFFGTPVWLVFRVSKRIGPRSLALAVGLTPASTLASGILASDASGPHRGFFPDVFTDRSFLLGAPIAWMLLWTVVCYRVLVWYRARRPSSHTDEDATNA
ncbi:MAG: hypothetical protein OXU20_39385 [Myxococcales bacterium]|nr:hypothetical protein [Myxococcales bacterium]MDD9970641.1 hypothetical protein [Myxococcales bacterium]